MALNSQDVPRVPNPLTPIVLKNVNCSRKEGSSMLGECDHEPVQHCDHSKDVGIFCGKCYTVYDEWMLYLYSYHAHTIIPSFLCTRTLLDIACNDNDLRLFQYDGQMENEGRVDLCQDGQWRQLCRDFLDNNAARVVCRQLGFTVTGIIIMTKYRYILWLLSILITQWIKFHSYISFRWRCISN